MLYSVGLATDGVCVFVRLLCGRTFFIFKIQYEGDKPMKKANILLFVVALTVLALALSSCAGCFGVPDNRDDPAVSPGYDDAATSDDNGGNGNNGGSGSPDDSGDIGNNTGDGIGDDSGNQGDDSGNQGDKPDEPHVHAFGEWSVLKEATCTEAGTKEATCECGEKKTETIPAKGHTFGEWSVLKEATCTEAGTKEAACECGEKKTETIPAMGHTAGEWTTVTEATCTEAGSKKAVCTVCGAEETEIIPAKGHTFGEWITIMEVTCTRNGIKMAICGSCASTKNEDIPAKGHTIVIDEAKAPTCTDMGLTEGKHCSVCNTVFEPQILIPALEHNFVDGVCDRCNEKKASEGLKYTLNSDGQSYSVSAGNCQDRDIIIPSRYNGKPVTSISDNAFYEFKSQVAITVTIPDSVTRIGKYAFYRFTTLASIKIGNGIKSIGPFAFYGCTGLTSLTIPDGVTSIYNETFAFCSNLQSIVIPGSVTNIYMKSFYYCQGLTSITFNGTKAQWEAITKELYWNSLTGKYTVTCTDGKISKS